MTPRPGNAEVLFKSLYNVGIELAPSKTFDWMSIISYFKALNS
jgi:hypothetical protein